MSLTDRIRSLTPQQRQLLLERLSQPDDPNGAQKEIAAYVVFRGGGSPIEELRAFAAAQLPEFMMPKHLIPLPSLPQHPNGKVNRQALPEPQPEPVKAAESIRMPNEIEARLAKLWNEVLRIEITGLDDNFFQLGGHSLLALQLMARVRETFKADLPIKALFTSPTVAGLAQAISKCPSGSASIRRISRRDSTSSTDISQNRI